MLGLLDRLHAAAADAGRDGSLLEIRVLQALAHHAHGDLPQALAALEPGLVEAPEPESYVRLYLDEGAPMLALLHHAAGAGHDPTSTARRCRSRPAGSSSERRRRVEGAEPQQSLVDPLSQRELEVLRLLDSELTGPEIARELYVSLNTLRTHTKRIFTKLDVTTRAAAVRRAHERGLALVAGRPGVTTSITSCGDAGSPRRFLGFRSSPRRPPRTNPNRSRHDHHTHHPHPGGRRRRRRRRTDLHRRPDQPPAPGRHLRHHDRSGPSATP